MRDVSHKVSTLRTAVAKAILRVSPSTIQQIKNNTLPKGNPLDVAKVAAIQAAKNTSQIIPYCHPMPVEFVGVEFQLVQVAGIGVFGAHAGSQQASGILAVGAG